MYIKPKNTGSFVKRPGTPSYGMKADAARMAAEGGEFAKAPIVPTTSMKPPAQIKPSQSVYNAQVNQQPLNPTQPQGAPIAPNPQLGGPPAKGSIEAPAPVRSAKDIAKDKMRENAVAENATRQAPIDAATAENRAQMQQAQADLMARLGASGFGTSGAAGALSGNIQAKAARELANEVFGIQMKQNADSRAERGLDHQIDTDDRRLDAEEAARQAEQDAANITNGGFSDQDGDGFMDGMNSGAQFNQDQWTNRQAISGNTERDHFGDLDWGTGINAMGQDNGNKNNPYILTASEDPSAAGFVEVPGGGPKGFRMWMDPQSGLYYIRNPRG